MRKRILIVDDDEPTQRLLRAIMRRQDLDVIVAGSGAEAIRILGEKRFDVVLLDLMMPNVTGTDVLEFLATLERKPPVILCSASKSLGGPFDAVLVKAVIRKPFDIDDLVAAVRAVAGIHVPPANARVLIIDDDLRARFVMRAFAEPAESMEADSAEAARAMIRAHRPDIVLLDLTLPGGTPGEELLEQLRHDPATADLPVIIVTSRKLTAAERKRLLEYAVDVIDKGDLSRATLGGALQHALQ